MALNVHEWIEDLVSRAVGPSRRFLWHFNEGDEAYKNADANRSIRHYRECLKIVPEQWLAWYRLSIVYSQLIGDLEESLRLLRYARRLRERQCTPPAGKPPHRFL